MTDEFYQKLKNENKIFKFKNKNPNTTLTEDYLFFLKKLDESNVPFKDIQEGEVVEDLVRGLETMVNEEYFEGRDEIPQFIDEVKINDRIAKT
jgi:hypothetical protein